MTTTELAKQQLRYTISKFRVKIKSLAEEARIIRAEEKKNAGWVRNGLREHRIGKVRDEQRHTLLAYAILRGVPYAAVEGSCDKQPRQRDIERILNSLSWPRTTTVDVKQWLNVKTDAKAA